MAAISQPRPTRSTSLAAIARPDWIATRRRAGTGATEPLISTSCGSPSRAAESNNCAVDWLTITVPGSATDSI
ncbi:MAG TPA: hypothetical protein PL146_12210, partial [Mycobacterium sp.]|nr:hypothetical protein [Mycobacterium sp.]